MVNMDGFILTHGMEPVELAEEKDVNKFLGPYVPPYKLDVENPLSFGLLGDPTVYLETRYAIHKTMEDVLDVIPAIGREFESIFGRKGIDLVEEYNLEGSNTVIVSMGSVNGTIKDFVDQHKGIGLLKIITYRPFPKKKIYDLLQGRKKVLVLEKDISLGSDGALYTEVKSLFNSGTPEVSGFIAGLGGRDITFSTLEEMLKIAEEKQVSSYFLDVDYSLLKEEFYV